MISARKCVYISSSLLQFPAAVRREPLNCVKALICCCNFFSTSSTLIHHLAFTSKHDLDSNEETARCSLSFSQSQCEKYRSGFLRRFHMLEWSVTSTSSNSNQFSHFLLQVSALILVSGFLHYRKISFPSPPFFFLIIFADHTATAFLSFPLSKALHTVASVW